MIPIDQHVHSFKKDIAHQQDVYTIIPSEQATMSPLIELVIQNITQPILMKSTSTLQTVTRIVTPQNMNMMTSLLFTIIDYLTQTILKPHCLKKIAHPH